MIDPSTQKKRRFQGWGRKVDILAEYLFSPYCALIPTLLRSRNPVAIACEGVESLFLLTHKAWHSWEHIRGQAHWSIYVHLTLASRILQLKKIVGKSSSFSWVKGKFILLFAGVREKQKVVKPDCHIRISKLRLTPTKTFSELFERYTSWNLHSRSSHIINRENT